VDESREQTKAILAAQRAMEARGPGERERILRVHQNAQRLLESVPVVNPFAPKLAFPDDRLSARRDHRKYLGLIRAVAFLHQHQRKRDGGAIVVAPEDVAIANRLAPHALGASIDDLSPPSRRLLVEIREWLQVRESKEPWFSQRELREHIGWKRSQLAAHVKELVEAEYLLSRQLAAGRRARYMLEWDGSGRRFRGLIDVEASTSVHGGSGRSKPNPKAPPGPEDGEIAGSVRPGGEE
jgi:DNA-binding MarR family transcriptional regulator